MNKLIVVTNDNKVKLWENLGQSPSAIHAAGHNYVGKTSEYSEENLEQMQADIDSGECFKYGSGSLKDWGIAKYNLA